MATQGVIVAQRSNTTVVLTPQILSISSRPQIDRSKGRKGRLKTGAGAREGERTALKTRSVCCHICAWVSAVLTFASPESSMSSMFASAHARHTSVDVIDRWSTL